MTDYAFCPCGVHLPAGCYQVYLEDGFHRPGGPCGDDDDQALAHGLRDWGADL